MRRKSDLKYGNPKVLMLRLFVFLAFLCSSTHNSAQAYKLTYNVTLLQHLSLFLHFKIQT